MPVFSRQHIYVAIMLRILFLLITDPVPPVVLLEQWFCHGDYVMIV